MKETEMMKLARCAGTVWDLFDEMLEEKKSPVSQQCMTDALALVLEEIQSAKKPKEFARALAEVLVGQEEAVEPELKNVA